MADEFIPVDDEFTPVEEFVPIEEPITPTSNESYLQKNFTAHMGVEDTKNMQMSTDPKATRIGGVVALTDIPKYLSMGTNVLFSPFSGLMIQAARAVGKVESWFGADYGQATEENMKALGNIFNSVGYVASLAVDTAKSPFMKQDPETAKMAFIDKVMTRLKSGKTLGQSYVETMELMGFDKGEVAQMVNQISSQMIDLTTSVGTFKASAKLGKVTEGRQIASTIKEAGKVEMKQVNAENVVAAEVQKLENINKEINRQVEMEQLAKRGEIKAKEVVGEQVSPMEVLQAEKPTVSEKVGKQLNVKHPNIATKQFGQYKIQEGESASSVVDVPLKDIIANQSLVDSKVVSSYENKINSNSSIDPVVLKEKNGKLELVDGYHRSVALSNIGKKSVPAIIIENSDIPITERLSSKYSSIIKKASGKSDLTSKNINKVNEQLDLESLSAENEALVKEAGYRDMDAFVAEQNKLISEMESNSKFKTSVNEKGEIVVEDLHPDNFVMAKIKATLGNIAEGGSKIREKWTDVQRTISSSGPVGEQFATRLKNLIYKDNEYSAKYKTPLRQQRVFQKFDKFLSFQKIKWSENLFDVIEKNAKPLNDTVARAAEAIKASLELISDDAMARGKIVEFADGSKLPFAPRDNYIPHHLMYDLYRKGGKYRQEGILKIANKAGAVDKMGVKTAEAALDALIDRHDNPNASNSVRNANLAYAREVGLDGYSRDLSNVERYIDQAAKEFATDDIMGKDRKILEKSRQDYMKESGLDGTKVDTMLRMFSDIMPEGNKMGITERTVKQIYNMAKLPFVALGHLSQTAYLARYPGWEVWNKNVKSMIDEARRTGALEEEYRSFQNASKDYLSSWWISRKFMQGTQLTPMRIFTKALAGEKAVNYAFRQLDLLKENQVDNAKLQTVLKYGTDMFADKSTLVKYKEMINAKARLAEFGIDPEAVNKRGYLTPEEILDVRRKGANYVFGEQHATNFPLFKSSGFIGRNMFMYKADQYINFKTITHDLIQKEGIERGNWMPVIKIVALGAPMGAGISMVLRRLVKGQPISKSDESLLDFYLQAALTAHFIGAAQDMYSSAKYGSLSNMVAGPLVTEGSKAVKNVITGNEEGLKKQGVGLLPGGSILQEWNYPKEQ